MNGCPTRMNNIHAAKAGTETRNVVRLTRERKAVRFPEATSQKKNVEKFSRSPRGKNLILSLFGPGDVVGVSTALGGGETCESSLVAVVDTELLEIRGEELYRLFAERPMLTGQILPALTRHLSECRHCLVESVCARVESRFASLFLRLAERMGEPVHSGDVIPVPLSRQELADLTGTTIETAIRVMSRWGKKGLVETRNGEGFLLSDRSALEQLAWQ